MHDLSTVQTIAVWVIPVLFAITVHEVAHGWVAKLLGDPTAMMLGRLTLNPIKHVDPVGTLIVPGVLLTFGGVLFGWAKPVPITWENLKFPKRDIALVAIAGPLANLVMALGWACLLNVVISFDDGSQTFRYLRMVAEAGIQINVLLFLFNLLPIPPLDGGRVLTGLLPEPWAWRVSRVEPYGLVILVLLILSGIFAQIIMWPFEMLLTFFHWFSGIGG